jgi:uncharacterized protein
MFQTITIAAANEESSRQSSSFVTVQVSRLEQGQENEVIRFLSLRPLHTVAMMSLILDNGLVSPLNRGTFYGCRDINGRLEGVALVGHATLIETVSDRALNALAKTARECPHIHLIMGEQDRIAELWTSYAEIGLLPRLACREWLLELRRLAKSPEVLPDLRLATADELDLVMPIQAQLAFEESGVDPLKIDPAGFRKRCLRRIKQRRTWVLMEKGSLIFKADIISRAAEVIYLEGIWVREDRRNDGLGLRCMSDLSQRLLKEVRSICLLVNETNKRALSFYRQCGFQFRATYESIFLARKEQYLH